MTEVLLGIILFLLILLVFVLLKKTRVETQDIESAIFRVWKESGLSDKVGEVATYAREIKEIHTSIEQMLRVPVERGAFGEMALETILSDQLPPDMFGIRERILDGKIPDAHIKSTVGIICIDSKFPLDNYRKMMESNDSEERENYKRQFLKDSKAHLEKIANDYVCVDKGSADFAFAYIPSESVYWFLVNEAFEMLRNYTKKGVQVVSPLTLSHKIELIKAGVNAKKLSEGAERVKNAIVKLSRQFESVDEAWRVLYKTHLKNLMGKAEELDEAYRKLREEFEKTANLWEAEG
ncbi:MAG: recombination protein RmuC [Candidatus Atribacteria bacterium]|jgi:DNA recombination protein RmuC|nr:recombination protein RmuC [Candidatus Atribacteria bacterium]